MTARWAPLLAALLLAGSPLAAEAQVFLASRPHPQFTVGPLFIRARVGPEPGPTPVDVLWSLAIPPGVSAADVEQDLYLLWPGEVVPDPGAGPPDRIDRRDRIGGYDRIGGPTASPVRGG